MIRKAKALNGSLHFTLGGTNFNPFSKNLSENSPCFIPSPTYHEGLNEFLINSREDLSNRDNAITLVKSPNNTKLTAIRQIVFLGVDILLDNICT